MIQWTTPLMLLGLGLLAMPVIAHLMNRRSRTTYFVPTIRFLKQSNAQQNRLINLKRWLLLLLRTAAIALIVSMFARPVWWQGNAPSPKKDAVAMVVVMDASVSTSRQLGNVELFQKMKASGNRALNELEVGRDFANIVMAKRVPKMLLRNLSLNTDELKRQLEAESWSYEQADMEAAIAEAVAQLAAHQGQKSIVVVSDWQKTNWQNASGKSSIEIPDDVKVSFVDLDIDENSNVALSAASCQPPDPIDGQKIQVSVEVSNFSDRVRQVPVRLASGSVQLGEQLIKLEPRQSRVVSFPVQFDSQRMEAFTLKTSSDGLTADDVAYTAPFSPRRIPLTVITDDQPDEAGTATWFLERAILPFDSQADRYAVQSLAVKDVRENRLVGQEIVVVGYVTRWNPDAAKLLIEFVRTGGKLLYLCGEGDVANQIQQIESQATEAFFPFQLTQLNRFKKFDETLYVSSGKWRSRWLRDFDFQSQIALAEVRFQNVWGTSKQQDDANIVLQYSDGRPTLGVRNFGTGTIVLANLSPAIRFSEFGKFGSFAALVQIVIRGLNEDAENSSRKIVGEPIVFPMPEDSSSGELDWSVVGPEETDLSPILSDGGRSVLVSNTSTPGLYQLKVGTTWSQSAAVEIERDESDLTAMNLDEVQNAISAVEARTATSDGFAISLFDKGSPLWGWVALGALGLMSMESLMLGWWKR
ncbi:BatA domain-containing protein [Mariniblastus fucicola]|uniref:Aerotolerance regulator N-terminal domain-containing protein n=1 Tax=Mariniblastus fucicola TaxID=980251 RepID=A0A5B9PI19_9BACT|nr:BatA domain-containing protein [Mariniblastus fucicola]QEG22471.1 hypothetical protein MFFC18_23510 [Mariniblastus fucicola]